MKFRCGFMQVKRAVKTVSKTGDSLTVAITKEAKALGLDKGDSVTIMVGDLSPEEVRNFDLAMSLSNRNAFYTNQYWLNSSDHYIDGSKIEDMSDTLDPDVMLETQERLYALRWFKERAERFIRERITGPHAFYSDSQRSFIVKFMPVLEPDDRSNDFTKTRYYLEILEDALKDSYTLDCPLNSVTSISASVARALKDIREVEGLDDGAIDEKVRELNKKWEEENTKKRYPDTWYFSISITYEFNGTDYDPTGYPEFKLYEGPYKKYVEAIVDEYDAHMVGEYQERSSIVIGPFGTKEDASTIMSYLKMDALRNKTLGTMDYLKKVKPLAYELMDSLDNNGDVI